MLYKADQLMNGQQPNESVTDFVREFRVLADQCKYTAISEIEANGEAMRDTLVTGMSSRRICQNLLQHTQLSLDKVVEYVLIFEHVETNSCMYAERAQFKPISDSIQLMASQTSNADGVIDNKQRNDIITLLLCVPCSKAKFHQKKNVFYRGSIAHPRQQCPARNEIFIAVKKLFILPDCVSLRNLSSRQVLTSSNHYYSCERFIYINIDGTHEALKTS
ncbi:hypothetical protein GJ496_003455 [Pomphorhynchus laevis]|nr:hypothetical protein GJ496_003455 [Pomphorhynchus laevis]